MLIGAIPFLSGIILGLNTDSPAVPVFSVSILIGVLIYVYFGISCDKTVHIYFKTAVILICIASFLTGVYRGITENRICRDSLNFFSVERKITLSGRVYKTEYKNKTYRYYLKDISIDGISEKYRGRLLVVSKDEDEPVMPVAFIIVNGTTAGLRVAENDGAFSERDYYRSLGVYGKVKAGDMIIDSYPKFDISAKLYKFRITMGKVYEESLPGEEPGILSAMTLGDRDGLSEDIKELFQSAGIAHILAISGLHISIVGQALYKLLRRHTSAFAAGTLSFIAVILYGLMTGGSVSTIRAVVMYGILRLSDITGKAYDTLSALSVCAMISLFIQPMYISNGGFIFSYSAVLGVCTVSNPLAKAYYIYAKKRWETIHRKDHGQKFKRSINERIIYGMIFAVSIWIFTLPIIAFNYYAVPIYVIGLNLIFIPILKYVVAGGLIGGIAGSIAASGIIQSILYLFRTGSMFVCHVILYIYEYLSDRSLTLPYASLTVGKCSYIRMALYYAVLYGVCAYITYRSKLYERIPEERIRGRRFYVYFSHRIYKVLASLCTVAVLALVLLKIPHRRGMTIDMLYVGQGDGIVIASEEGEVFMIDGGSSSNESLDEYVLLPYLKYHGYDHIDWWLISHMDDDHYNGVYKLMESGYRIDNLVIAKGAYRNDAYYDICDTAKAAGTQIVLVEPDERICTESMSLTCLHPYIDSTYEDTNASSMVLWLSYGDFDALFTGDMGIGEEEEMIDIGEINDLAKNRSLEVLKVAHHGSKNSSGSRWLDILDPYLAIISAGKNNLYHHPSKETLDRFEERDIDHLCTLDCGQISIKPYENGKTEVKKYFTCI